MQHTTPAPLPDFDTLATLAEQDPEGFEELRQQHIEALIASAPATTRQRLRGLQFQIDAQRRLHSNPLAACIKISQMMHDSFHQLRQLLGAFAANPTGTPGLTEDNTSASQRRSAQIVAFPGCQ